MSEQTTANTPAEPKLCKMGCGFFGNGATGDCCSKCWGEQQKKKQGAAATTKQVVQKPMEVVAEEPSPMDVDTAPVVEEKKLAADTTTTPKKRKKKKATYKNMMANMMQGSGDSKDIDKEKERLRKVTGGGAFSKIEKI